MNLNEEVAKYENTNPDKEFKLADEQPPDFAPVSEWTFSPKLWWRPKNRANAGAGI